MQETSLVHAGFLAWFILWPRRLRRLCSFEISGCLWTTRCCNTEGHTCHSHCCETSDTTYQTCRSYQSFILSSANLNLLEIDTCDSVFWAVGLRPWGITKTFLSSFYVFILFIKILEWECNDHSILSTWNLHFTKKQSTLQQGLIRPSSSDICEKWLEKFLNYKQSTFLSRLLCLFKFFSADPCCIAYRNSKLEWLVD
jgi:hypothetical protein